MSSPLFGGYHCQSGSNAGWQRPLYRAQNYDYPPHSSGSSDSEHSFPSSPPGRSNYSQGSPVYHHTFTESPGTSPVNGEPLTLWTAGISAQPSVPPQNYVQMLEQELSVAKERIQEYEITIAHQANFISHTSPVENQNQMPHTHFSTTSPRSHRQHLASSRLNPQSENAGIVSAGFPNYTAPEFHNPLFPPITDLVGTIHVPPPSWLGSQFRPSRPNRHVHATSDPASLGSVAKRQRDWINEEARKKARISTMPTSSGSSSWQPYSGIAIPPRPNSSSSCSTSTDFDDDSTAVSSHSNMPDLSIEFCLEVDRALEVNLTHTIIDKRGAFCIKFSPDGQILAVAARWGQVISMYNVATGARICLLEDLYVKDRPPEMQELCFSPNGHYLATCTEDPEKVIRVWDVDRRRIQCILQGHAKSIYCLDFSPDGRLLCSGSSDKTVRIWNTRDGSSQIFYNSTSGISSVRLSPDKKYVAAGTFHGGVFIWELRSRQLVGSLKGHTDFVDNIVFMPDGEGLITCSWDKTLKHWDISRPASDRMSDETRAVDDVENTEFKSLTFVGHTHQIRSISITSNGQWIASCSLDRSVRIWNSGTGEQQCILQGHNANVFTVDFSPVGGYLASASEDGRVRIWNYRALDSQ